MAIVRNNELMENLVKIGLILQNSGVTMGNESISPKQNVKEMAQHVQMDSEKASQAVDIYKKIVIEQDNQQEIQQDRKKFKGGKAREEGKTAEEQLAQAKKLSKAATLTEEEIENQTKSNLIDKAMQKAAAFGLALIQRMSKEFQKMQQELERRLLREKELELEEKKREKEKEKSEKFDKGADDLWRAIMGNEIADKFAAKMGTDMDKAVEVAKGLQGVLSQDSSKFVDSLNPKGSKQRAPDLSTPLPGKVQ